VRVAVRRDLLEVVRHPRDPLRRQRRRLGREPQALRGPSEAGEPEEHADFVLVRPAEHRRLRLETSGSGTPAEVGLEDLADFIRLGTPSGLSTMSTEVPSGRNGMSSSGTIRATMPLLPCRPAILSPTEIFRFSAI
jgi:hypothetical protein